MFITKIYEYECLNFDPLCGHPMLMGFLYFHIKIFELFLFLTIGSKN